MAKAMTHDERERMAKQMYGIGVSDEVTACMTDAELQAAWTTAKNHPLISRLMEDFDEIMKKEK